MLQHTPLHDMHRSAGAKMVDFGGWSMPLHYGSQLSEHRQVREAAGLFDVSHMAVVDIFGPGVRDYLRLLLANDIARLAGPGLAQYACMLNQQGGIVDDLIVYYLSEDHYRCVVNAATSQADLAWMQQCAGGFELSIRQRQDLAIVAVQGPSARALLAKQLGGSLAPVVSALRPFQTIEAGQWQIACTGYTGEDGFEVILPDHQAGEFWARLMTAGAAPCGLGARDSLRLEAGLCLYGQDMDQSTSPLSSGLGWTVAWEPRARTFIGRAALEAERAAGPARVLKGLILEGRGMLRHGQVVALPDGQEGLITSGGYSPVLEQSIALARLPVSTAMQVSVDLRGKSLTARLVKPPFVRRGKALVR